MISAFLASLLLFVTASSENDPVRQSLQANSDKWFHWLVISSVVVGIGVCLEAPEATITLKRWYGHWRGKEVASENLKSWAIPASYLGLLLVVAGVGGEGIFESLASNADTALRAHDEQILAYTIRSAGDAKDSANAAQVAGQKAQGEANSVALKTDALEVRLRKDSVQLDKLENWSRWDGPRFTVISNARERFKQNLKDFTRQRFAISLCGPQQLSIEGLETSGTAEMLRDELGYAGWIQIDFPRSPARDDCWYARTTSGGSLQGIGLEVALDAPTETRKAAAFLQSMLNVLLTQDILVDEKFPREFKAHGNVLEAGVIKILVFTHPMYPIEPSVKDKALFGKQ